MKLPEMITTHEARRRCPEERVLLAVINLACTDAMEKPLGKWPHQKLTENAKTALRFLYGTGFERYCAALGFDAVYMRRKLETNKMDGLTDKGRITTEYRRTFLANLHLWKQKVKMR
jgi:hypothetical protein